MTRYLLLLLLAVSLSTHAQDKIVKLGDLAGVSIVPSYNRTVYVSANYILSAADHAKVLVITAAGVSITVPAGLPEGFYCEFDQNNTSGTTTITGSGVYIRGATGGDGNTNKLTVAWQTGRLAWRAGGWYNFIRSN